MAWNDDIDVESAAYKLAASNDEVVRAVAGPGSGKSFAIRRKVSRLLEEGVAPSEILAITFTRTAAQDLKAEIQSLGIEGAGSVHARTLHSHALKILMNEEVLAATNRHPRMVLDHEVGPAFYDIQKDEYGGIANLKSLFSSYLASWATLQNDDPYVVIDPIQLNFQNDIVEWLKKHNGIHVGEVIPVAINYLRHNPASENIGAYRIILVDEYQDLNKSEQEFIHLIKGQGKIVIVGDDDQSIYGFKHAHPEGIQQIGELYGPYMNVTFDVCRRCPTRVTSMASELICKNSNRTLGDLEPFIDNSEGIVNIKQYATYEDEIAGITEAVIEELGKGIITPSDILILTPRRIEGYRLRNSLQARDIPVKSYFREAVIKDDRVKYAYSLLNYLVNPNDKISLRFLLGSNSASFRYTQYLRLSDCATKNKISITEVLDGIIDGKFAIPYCTHIIKKYEEIKRDLENLKEKLLEDIENGMLSFLEEITPLTDELDAEDLYYEFLREYNYAYSLLDYEEINQDNINIALSELFVLLQGNMSMPSIPDSIDHVRIMSLHASKGLSAKFVILCSMIDELMPYMPDSLNAEDSESNIEEHRRLFYVAITRCKAANDYPGRLLISSYLSIDSRDARLMGIKVNTTGMQRVRATRFLRDFIESAPTPEVG